MILLAQNLTCIDYITDISLDEINKERSELHIIQTSIMNAQNKIKKYYFIVALLILHNKNTLGL